MLFLCQSVNQTCIEKHTLNRKLIPIRSHEFQSKSTVLHLFSLNSSTLVLLSVYHFQPSPSVSLSLSASIKASLFLCISVTYILSSSLFLPLAISVLPLHIYDSNHFHIPNYHCVFEPMTIHISHLTQFLWLQIHKKWPYSIFFSWSWHSYFSYFWGGKNHRD